MQANNGTQVVAGREWWGPGHAWLCRKASEHYAAWRAGAGRKWSGKGSPYNAGYEQPDWMREARKALGKNDEHAFKAIKLNNL